jgi:hypothetical protein
MNYYTLIIKPDRDIDLKMKGKSILLSEQYF